MKNIVIIPGSSRKNGNSELLAKAFMEGAQQSGHNVFLFEVANKKLSCCIACETCFSKGQACSIPDDFNELAPIIENADTIVFCTPLYWGTFSAKIKMVLDKMCSFNNAKKETKIKEAVLLVCGATDNAKDFDGIIKTYEIILNYQGWKNAGILIVQNVTKIGDIKKTVGLNMAKEMGKKI
jgi:multimeric flavodoxin WrbA